jgi:DNA-binding MarR family transcriptional regulator
VTSPGPHDYQDAAELRSALRRFLHHSEEIARRSGLTPQQYLLLLMIKGARGGRETSTVSELVERLSLTQSTVTELVHRAAEHGLVRREPSAVDGRVVELTLTEKGEAALGAAVAEHGNERETLLAMLRIEETSSRGHGSD